MVFCGNCGTENSAGAKFCSDCGAELSEILDEKTSTKPKSDKFSEIMMWIFGIFLILVGIFDLIHNGGSLGGLLFLIGGVIMVPRIGKLSGGSRLAICFAFMIAGVLLLPPTDDSTSNTNVAPIKTTAKELVSTSFSDFGAVYCDSDATNLQKQALFDDKFKGKYVKWSGTVSSVSETWGSYTLQVKHCPDTWVSDIVVAMRDNQKDALLQLREGDKVTYIAKLTRCGDILGISAEDGEIVF